jgi:hypothetical protein
MGQEQHDGGGGGDQLGSNQQEGGGEERSSGQERGKAIKIVGSAGGGGGTRKNSDIKSVSEWLAAPEKRKSHLTVISPIICQAIDVWPSLRLFYYFAVYCNVAQADLGTTSVVH